MAFYTTSSILDINEGVTANDGTGDSIRDAFLKVDDNFRYISQFLTQGSIEGSGVDFYNANVSQNFKVNFANVSNMYVANATGLNSRFIGNTTSNLFIANSGVISNGDIIVSGNILPTAGGVYNLGSVSRPFGTIYFTTSVTGTVVQSTDGGLLVVHANAATGSVKDVGIFGNVSHSYTSNAYAFFGFQYASDDFVYKITPTNWAGNGDVVSDGVYGNTRFGSQFLSNTTISNSTSTGALIVAGGVGIAGNVNVGENLGVSNNAAFGGNVDVSGSISSAGFPVLTTGTIGFYGTPLSGGIILGNTTFQSSFNSFSTNSGAVTILGGLGVGGNIVANGILGPFYGNVTKADQPLITSLGSLGNLTVLGQTTTGSLQTTTIGVQNIVATGNVNVSTINGLLALAVTGNVTAGGFIGPVFGTVQTAAQPNITSVGTLTSLAVAGNVSTGNVSGTKGTFTQVQGTVITAAQPNITSVGTLTALTVSGNTAVNNTLYGRGVYDNSNRVVSLSAGAGNITVNSNGTAYLTQTGPGAVTQGNATHISTVTTDVYGRVSTMTPTAIANIVLAGTSGTGGVAPGATLTFSSSNGVTVTASGGGLNIATAQDLRTTASPTFANITVGNIAPAANNVSNIGSVTNWYNTFFGVSSQARYADLAERYVADIDYEPGTVVVFGGEKEITTTHFFADTRVAGAISTNPAYLMNAADPGLPLALRGKVPVKLIGPVTKGDLLVTAGANPGHAISVGSNKEYGPAVFAKALETDLADGKKIIMAMIL